MYYQNHRIYPSMNHNDNYSDNKHINISSSMTVIGMNVDSE